MLLSIHKKSRVIDSCIARCFHTCTVILYFIVIYLHFWLLLIVVFLLRKHGMVPLFYYLVSDILIQQLCGTLDVKLKVYNRAAMGALSESTLPESRIMICTMANFISLR